MDKRELGTQRRRNAEEPTRPFVLTIDIDTKDGAWPFYFMYIGSQNLQRPIIVQGFEPLRVSDTKWRQASRLVVKGDFNPGETDEFRHMSEEEWNSIMTIKVPGEWDLRITKNFTVEGKVARTGFMIVRIRVNEDDYEEYKIE